MPARLPARVKLRDLPERKKRRREQLSGDSQKLAGAFLDMVACQEREKKRREAREDVRWAPGVKDDVVKKMKLKRWDDHERHRALFAQAHAELTKLKVDARPTAPQHSRREKFRMHNLFGLNSLKLRVASTA